MGQLTRGQTLAIVALLALVTGWVGVAALRTDRPSVAPGIVVREAPSGSTSYPPVPPSGVPGQPASVGTSGAELIVHVAGAVKRPGVYRLPPGARNDDAVKAAGGFTASAAPDAINLAAHCEDGMQLYIPTRSEHPSGGASSVGTSAPVSASPALASHTKSAKSSGSSGRSSSKLVDPAQGKIDLNTADSTQLQRIPGIGPAMAERILAYRHTVGRFRSKEEMLQVSGIGEKKFEKMKPFLSVH